MRATVLRNFTSQHKLFAAITVAVIITLILTLLSMSLYYTSGAEVLDLSRPGYEGVRQAVNNAPHDEVNFSGDGPIDSEVINKFQALFEANRSDLKAIDSFSNQKPLSDSSLSLTAESANKISE